MKVLVIEHNKKPEVRGIDGSLKSMQNIVEGYIELCPVGRSLKIEEY